jgi:hypothetical protein
MDIKSLLQAKQAILKSKLDILLSHPVTKGEHCESAWIDFFRSFLPSKYAVDKGFVFDSKGKVSEQIDIIIYDSLYAPLIFGTDAGEKFITAESVYAVFDSKPEINKDTLEYTDKKIKSVTSLYRSSRGFLNGGNVCKARELTKIIGGILAIDSISLDSIKDYAVTYTNIDTGCAIKKHSFLVNRDKDRNFKSIDSSNNDEIVLAFFYIILDELYQLGTVAGIDIRDYADATLDSFKLSRNKEI